MNTRLFSVSLAAAIALTLGAPVALTAQEAGTAAHEPPPSATQPDMGREESTPRSQQDPVTETPSQQDVRGPAGINTLPEEEDEREPPVAGTSERAESESATTRTEEPRTLTAEAPRDSAQGQQRQDAKSTERQQPSGVLQTMPVVVLVPVAVATNESLEDGCWARLYDSENYRGNMLTLAGPVSVPDARPATVTGFELGSNFDSLIVGPNATLQVWEDEQYRDDSVTFQAGQRVADLDRRTGHFQNMESMRVTCTKQRQDQR